MDKIINNLDNELNINYNRYLEKKLILKIITNVLDEYKDKINNYNKIIEEINKELEYYEILYIKENINNYSDNILIKIKKNNDRLSSINIDMETYEFNININKFTKNILIKEINTLQNDIEELNKRKKRVKRWYKIKNNNNKLFELNLNNIIFKNNT